MPAKTITRNGHSRNSLTEGHLFSSVVRFTLPFLLSNLLQTLYKPDKTSYRKHRAVSRNQTRFEAATKR